MSTPRRFTARVTRWRNALAIRLPQSIEDALGLKEGDEIDIHIVGCSSVTLDRSTAYELLRGLRKFRGLLPADFRFDRAEANERR